MDCGGETGLRNEEFFGGLGDISGLGYGDGVLELFECHGVYHILRQQSAADGMFSFPIRNDGMSIEPKRCD